jgi:L-lactate dehydrogenase complex protein LldG
MNSRDKILNTLRANAQSSVAHPSPWSSRRNFPDLAERFSQSLTASKGEVYRAKNLTEALEQVEVILSELHAKQVVVNDTAPLNSFDPTTRWPDFTWHMVGKSEGDLRAFCADADVGLSGADVALAETGSIIVSSDAGRSRLATLLPPIHVAVVPTSKLTADLFTWTAARKGPLSANTVIISGPSKTADIEQVLAIGVHGPKRFIVVLYED